MGNQGFKGEARALGSVICRAKKEIKLLHKSISTQLRKWVITRTCIIGKPDEGYRCHT